MTETDFPVKYQGPFPSSTASVIVTLRALAATLELSLQRGCSLRAEKLRIFLIFVSGHATQPGRDGQAFLHR